MVGQGLLSAVARRSAVSVQTRRTAMNYWGKNNFPNFAENLRTTEHHAKQSNRTYTKMFWFGVIPVMIGTSYIGYSDFNHHMTSPRPEFVPYPAKYVRHKKYPWGDTRSFFHSEQFNALPEGYEIEDPNEGKEHHH